MVFKTIFAALQIATQAGNGFIFSFELALRQAVKVV